MILYNSKTNKKDKNMKKTVNFYDFRKEFEEMDKGDNFSYAGLEALFNYFEEYEAATSEEIELDVIAICCEFTEYASVDEYYGEDGYVIEDIEHDHEVIRIPNTDRFIVGY